MINDVILLQAYERAVFADLVRGDGAGGSVGRVTGLESGEGTKIEDLNSFSDCCYSSLINY